MTPTNPNRPQSATPPPSIVLRTLLLADVVDSTKLIAARGDGWAARFEEAHDRLVRGLLEANHGMFIDKSDGFLALFERPIEAVRFALEYHSQLAAMEEGERGAIQARVGVHLGEVNIVENPPEAVARGAKPLDVTGLAKPMVARLMGLAEPGQTLLTKGAFDLARRASVGEVGPSSSLRWMAHGPYFFKGIDEAVDVYEVGTDGLAPLRPPRSTEKAQFATAPGDELTLGWRPGRGLDVPGRKNWLLREKLGEGGFGEVWLAEAAKTGERRVFKFCYDAGRLRALKREVTILRVLKESLGDRDDIARLLDWNFEEPPYYIESEYTEGGSLVDWAAQQGGLAAVSLEVRRELAAQVAEALAAAHSVGVLHKDIKPSNVLVRIGRDGRPKAQLADFGIGSMTDKAIMAAQGITMSGLTDTHASVSLAHTGTRMYLAPEVIEGKAPTTLSDIFSYGVLLYQLIRGDFTKALAVGWERTITDEALREEIRRCVEGNPVNRVPSAALIAEGLRGTGSFWTRMGFSVELPELVGAFLSYASMLVFCGLYLGLTGVVAFASTDSTSSLYWVVAVAIVVLGLVTMGPIAFLFLHGHLKKLAKARLRGEDITVEETKALMEVVAFAGAAPQLVLPSAIIDPLYRYHRDRFGEKVLARLIDAPDRGAEIRRMMGLSALPFLWAYLSGLGMVWMLEGFARTSVNLGGVSINADGPISVHGIMIFIMCAIVLVNGFGFIKYFRLRRDPKGLIGSLVAVVGAVVILFWGGSTGSSNTIPKTGPTPKTDRGPFVIGIGDGGEKLETSNLRLAYLTIQMSRLRDAGNLGQTTVASYYERKKELGNEVLALARAARQEKDENSMIAAFRLWIATFPFEPNDAAGTGLLSLAGVLEEYGRALEESGRRSEARRQWQRALALASAADVGNTPEDSGAATRIRSGLERLLERHPATNSAGEKPMPASYGVDAAGEALEDAGVANGIDMPVEGGSPTGVKPPQPPSLAPMGS